MFWRARCGAKNLISADLTWPIIKDTQQPIKVLCKLRTNQFDTLSRTFNCKNIGAAVNNVIVLVIVFSIIFINMNIVPLTKRHGFSGKAYAMIFAAIIEPFLIFQNAHGICRALPQSRRSGL